jgi:hypothetical protein
VTTAIIGVGNFRAPSPDISQPATGRRAGRTDGRTQWGSRAGSGRVSALVEDASRHGTSSCSRSAIRSRRWSEQAHLFENKVVVVLGLSA